LTNARPLALRDFRVTSEPDWGGLRAPHFREQQTITLELQGDVPAQRDQISFRLFWEGKNLLGHEVGGNIELAIGIAAPPPQELADTDLGGSPYVTGSPIEPLHGHQVFFGREDLIGQLSRQIRTHRNVVLLEGNSRTGKTSVLRHLEGREAIPGWLAVYTSLQ